ncbi:hypothetical protein EX895_005728 [Sporisorium graminicola]|uniref:FCP1 homology domain-containing protein n=1 Tax=Sporisorium graminicola TaxID=280036 RepID=A0A4U7KNS2_9BASI|nr:hypothetical protein EX895_005728 [Sporisorium graminicola]TKY85566.1 hypothetical protein EX895_005728 [Sporisorium graminicola]
MAASFISSALLKTAKRLRCNTHPSLQRVTAAMSAPYRHPHYGASSSRNRPWARNGEQGAAYSHAYDTYYHHQPQQYARTAEYRDPYAYESDHYAAYPPSLCDAPAAYAHARYDDAQANSWARHDDYAYGHQAQAFEGPWRQGGYDAQGYLRQPYEAASAPRYNYAAHARLQPHSAVQSSQLGSDNAVAAGTKSVQGAPAAPKKMREAAVASTVAPAQSWSGARAYQQPPAHVYNYNAFPQQQQQQQRDYHSYSESGAFSSRYQPYSRNSPSSSVPGTPSQMYRPPPPTQMPQRRPAAIRAAPRPKYLEQAKQASRELSEDEVLERKLLVVLDLNGTLVFRAKSGNGRAIDSARAVPRPFLSCFLQYCLGISTGDAAVEEGKQVDVATKPHGSHFWKTDTHAETPHAYEPRSAGKAEVIVWSSAQPSNVDSMVRASFDQSVRSLILRVWARDTLVPQRFFQHKAESIKDLEIVWAELNAFAHDRSSSGRLLAQARDEADQARPDDVAPASAPTAPAADKRYNGKKHKHNMKLHKQRQKAKEQPMSAALEAALRAEELGPWGAHNTVLVDDSVAKARLQPYNHLLIPEFGKEDAARMRKFIRQELASSSSDGDASGEEKELEYDSDLSIRDEPTVTTTAAASTTAHDADTAMVTDEPQPDRVETTRTTEAVADESAKEHKKKPIPDTRLDDVLLQTIGVLETLRHQSNVSAYIYHGGIKGYGQPKTSLNQSQRTDQVAAGLTPEFWAEEGRKVCAKLGIKVKAWVPGGAASATAALL